MLCEWSGKKTRGCKIRKEDVKAYPEERAIFPELYSAPKGWYGTHYVAKLSKELPEDTLRQKYMIKGFAMDDERLKNLGSGRKEKYEREYIIYASSETVRQHFLFLTGRTMRTAK